MYLKKILKTYLFLNKKDLFYNKNWSSKRHIIIQTDTHLSAYKILIWSSFFNNWRPNSQIFDFWWYIWNTSVLPTPGYLTSDDIFEIPVYSVIKHIRSQLNSIHPSFWILVAFIAVPHLLVLFTTTFIDWTQTSCKDTTTL